ncbi:MAG: FkbM family methyltransferase [Pseudorhodobacter sp.]|nr:FkbM family methyltransferase [Pseudorhodobacter sp.]
MFDEFFWTKVSEKRNDLTRVYEPIQIDLLRSLASRCANAVFLDIGANIGVYSIMLSRENSFSEFHAFEALSSLSMEIQKNLNLNDLQDLIHVHQVVLSDGAGEVEFIVRSDFAGDGGVRSTHQFSNFPYDRIEKLQKVALDGVVQIRGRDIVAKIDVEGHELMVLQGAKDTLRNNKGFLQIEILKNELLAETESLLASLGWFRLFTIDRDYYFSNIPDLDNADIRLELLESGLQTFVDRSRVGIGSPGRKRIVPGIVLEMRRSYVRRIKRLLRREP